MILSYLKNGLQNDLFCEMFIVSNGIQYLDDVIKYNEGNIREYALQIMSELFNFQSAYDSCDQNKEILLNLYQILTSDENINNSILAVDIIILIIRTNEEKISYLIDIAEKYSKKTNALMFSQILKYLFSKYNKTKLKTSVLMLINMVMTFSHPKKLLRVFIHLRDAGIFESINEARQLEDKTFEEQVKIFFDKAESAKTNPLYEIENYKIKIEDLKIKCDEIEKQYKSFEENEEIYDFIINYFQNLNIINQDDLDQNYFSNEIVNSDDSYGLSNSQELTEEENKKDALKGQELNISQTMNSSDSKQSIPPPPPPFQSVQEIPPPPPLGFFSNVNAQLNKGKNKLKMTLKKLLWKKIVRSHQKGSPMIWDNIKEKIFDENEIYKYFGKKKIESSKVEKKKSKVELKKFLDQKRTLKISIRLIYLPSPETVDKALETMGQSPLTVEQIEGLLEILITDEELKKYESMGDNENWDKPEKYLIEINNIPNHKIKLKLWFLINKFEQKIAYFSESLKYMADTCNQIKNDKHFRLILSIILGLGNILNAGTIRGQADGFSLDLLNTLPGVKDNFGNSILTWIYKKAKKIDPSFDGFKGEIMTLIEKASQFSLKETNNNLNTLKDYLSQLESLLKKLNVDDEFKQKSIIKFEELEKKLKYFIEKNDENMQCYENLVKYYGYKKNENEKNSIFDKNEVFFKMILDFFKEINKAKPKNDGKEIKKFSQKAHFAEITLKIKNKK